ncbi:MAG: hypothetical protein IPN25_06935 [Sphingobacteriales bacterium]|nr:hypothetical protein [Sphingobacteriales bacterium]
MSNSSIAVVLVAFTWLLFTSKSMFWGLGVSALRLIACLSDVLFSTSVVI